MMHSTASIPLDRSIHVDRDRGAARAAFMKLQAEQLAFYGVRAESRYIETRNPRLRVHLLQAGGGEPALIFHGGDGEAVTWAPLMAVLQGELAMYAIDRPGFGLTDPFDYRSVDLRQHAADFVVSVLDALGLSSATLVGGSMGGFFSLAASLAYPERVRKLILVGMPVGLLKSATSTSQARAQPSVTCGSLTLPRAKANDTPTPSRNLSSHRRRRSERARARRALS